MSAPQIQALKQQIVALAQSKQYAQAEPLALLLVQKAPKDLEAKLVLAQLQQAQGKIESALQQYLLAGKGKSPVSIPALTAAVQLAERTRFYAEGFVACKELIKRQPKDAKLHEKMAFFARIVKHDYLAQQHYQKAIRLSKPNFQLLFDCAETSNHLGDNSLALECYDKASQLNPENDECQYQAAFASNYSDTLSDQAVFARHRIFGERLESRYPDESSTATRGVLSKRSDRIRIGYVCQDFKQHSVAYFFLPIIEHHDTSKFEVFCYSDVANPDHITDRIKSKAEHWRDTIELDDTALYKTICDDQIDILVDLIGYTGRSRAGVFARRAAPTQVSYLAYPNTSGLSRMDYRITDEWADPDGLTEDIHTEALIRLKTGFLNFEQIDSSAPDVSQLPAQANDYVTFGSFNVFPKLSDTILDAWIAILKAVPKSRLLVKAKLFFEAEMKDKFARHFVKAGIKKERLVLIGLEPQISDHLKRYSQVDIHLDSFPYHGTTTTCEALWQGVPTVTLAGQSHRSRVGCSILTQVNLESYIAHTVEEYVQIAINKAADIEGLASLRASLRDTMTKSPLMQRQAFTHALEQSYVKMLEQAGSQH